MGQPLVLAWARSVASGSTATGSLTIPLMKRVGYKPQTAAAVEAAASSGGQILPPIMGAGAFIMSEITGILGRHNISIASVIQHETEEESSGIVPLIIMTHQASEGAMTEVIEAVNRLGCVRPGIVRMRVRV